MGGNTIGVLSRVSLSDELKNSGNATGIVIDRAAAYRVGGRFCAPANSGADLCVATSGG